MKLIKAPYISQEGKYPTGCESISAVMLLNYLGFLLTADEFIRTCLDKKDFEMRDGICYGPDPRKFFCGSPYDPEGFGCYAPVMVKALKKAVNGTYEVKDETGTPVQTLLNNYIDRDLPVLFWACIEMRPPVTGPSWKLLDTGETFTWISNEHCMLLVGYDEENYYFNDPYDSHGLISYPKTLAEDRHKAQYEMAVGLMPC